MTGELREARLWVTAVAVLIAASAYFIWLATPDLTFVNADHDLADTLWAGKAWGLQHPTGSPVFTSVSWLVARFTPTWGAEAHWFAVLLSAVPAGIIAAILYVKTKRIEAPLLICASQIVIAQATIPKYYIDVALVILLQWLSRDRWWFFPLSLLGICLHHLPGIAFLVILAWRWRQGYSIKWAPLVLITAAATYWLYWRFAVQPPSPVGWKGASFMAYMSGQGFLFLGISPWPIAPFLARLRDDALMIPASMGLGLVLLLWAKDRWLMALVGLFVLDVVGNLDAHTYTYLTIPAVLAILAATDRTDAPLRLRQLTAGCACLMIAWGFTHYAIGRNLDPAPTAARDMYEQMAALPAGSVVDLGQAGRVGAMEFMPLLLDGRIIATWPNDPKRGQYVATHCLVNIDMDHLRAVIVPVANGCDQFPS